MIDRRAACVGVLAALALGSGCAGTTLGSGPGKKIVAAKVPDAVPDAERAFEKGLRLLNRGPRHYDEAHEAMERAVEIDANLFEAWHNLGFIDVRKGRYPDAVENYQRALKIQPASRATALGLAQALQKAGDMSRAHALLRERVQADPADFELRLFYIAALRDGGEADQALEETLAILSRDSHSAEGFNALGLVYRTLKRNGLAETAFRRAAELDPRAAYVWNNLGLLSLDRGNDQEAFAHFSKATELDPSYSAALLNRAVVYLDCGAYDKAEAELLRAVAVRPADPEIHVALGVAARGRGKFAKAAQHYEKALELQDDYGPALYNLGVLFMDHQENKKRARESFLFFRKVASADDPRNEDARVRLQLLK